MSFRRFLSLVLSLVLASAVSACASSAGGSSGGGRQITERAGGNSTLIVRAQLAEYSGRTVLEAVERFNRRWLRASRGVGTVPGGLSGPAYARVVIDGTGRGNLDELDRIPADGVESIRFLTATEATTKYGTGFVGGVIEVTSRGR